MKKSKKKSETICIETIYPTTELPGPDGFYDDCPLCQELKRKWEAGEVERVPFFNWEEDEAS